MTKDLLMRLLLLQLFAAALVPSAAAYETVLEDTVIHSPISREIDVTSECECRAKCGMDPSCRAASYDAVADLCYMTDGGADTVTTRPLTDSVAFFKFSISPTPVEVFATEEGTNNGALANLRALCAAEGGEPLIIKTQEVKEKAVKLSAENPGGPFGWDPKTWISAHNCDGGMSECRWPDGTRVTDAVFTEEDFDKSGGDGPATLIDGNGKLDMSKEELMVYFHVLCSRNLH